MTLGCLGFNNGHVGGVDLEDHMAWEEKWSPSGLVIENNGKILCSVTPRFLLLHVIFVITVMMGNAASLLP